MGYISHAVSIVWTTLYRMAEKEFFCQILVDTGIFMHNTAFAFDNSGREGTYDMIIMGGHQYGSAALTDLF